MSRTYKVSELVILYLDAGHGRNGNPRRAFVLTHGVDGFLAAVDEGYAGEDAIAGLHVRFEGDTKVIVRALRRVVTGRIPTTPKYIKELLSPTVQRGMRDRGSVVSDVGIEVSE